MMTMGRRMSNIRAEHWGWLGAEQGRQALVARERLSMGSRNPREVCFSRLINPRNKELFWRGNRPSGRCTRQRPCHL